ncbi:hypothetical protein [Mammaliicoccus sciuri]|uniref:hypothetical protein n=1 Tax=Mammaliicoccus sciuri TaxID=1296 RepID=UPI001FB1F3D8|nr:hypothetical protein [Mammaliicoccus sciuri]MCJ0919860.1 hypothetical protein [Mammaliicoccus sciuri]MCJ0962703.1 hypothetical protein [Mammaliicoccus sciuri]
MKDKVQFVLIVLLGIVAFILFFGFVLSSIDPNNKLEAYTLAISFVGIFATFGGAYLGAKVSANTAIRLSRQDKNIENSIKILTILYEIDKLSKKLVEKVKCNKIKLEILKKDDGYIKSELVEYDTEYNEWQKCFSEISIYILGTNLSQEDIQCLEEPSYLLPYLNDYISRLTHSEKNEEGGSISKVNHDDLKDYLDELTIFQTNLLQIEQKVTSIKEKVINQFPR